MNLNQLRALLDKAKNVHPPQQEPSIFSVGGRGYYENPTTDLLAFFLNPNESHNLNGCFLKALLSCLPGTEGLNPRLRADPLRELPTPNMNRLDLVLKGDGWDLVLENKIFHEQINPFEDYELFAQRGLNDGERSLIYVVLSPSGKSDRSAWWGLSYSCFIKAAREQLKQYVADRHTNKWHVFAHEFLLHLENVTVEATVDTKAINFVFENLDKINKLTNLKNQVVDALESKVREKLNSEVPGYECYSRRHSWPDGPALRFASSTWESASDVVLYLSGASRPMRPSISVYLCGVDEKLTQEGRHVFLDDRANVWFEQNGKILCFNWELDHFDEDEVLRLIVEKSKCLMVFESQSR